MTRLQDLLSADDRIELNQSVRMITLIADNLRNEGEIAHGNELEANLLVIRALLAKPVEINN